MGIILIILIYFSVNYLNQPSSETDQISDKKQKETEKVLKKLADTAEEISQGGVQGTIEIDRDDDIGRIAESFNNLLSNFTDLLHTLDDISERSFSTSRKLTDATRRTSQSMSEVSATIQELTSTTQEMNNNMEQISEGAQEIDELAQDGLTQMEDMEEEMSMIMDTADKAGSKIKNLNDSMSEIEEIVEVISNIAKQTNLLALNAAIEAARAGDKGRGFAVVADEIRTLSQDTQDALEKISNLVENLTQETSRTVDIIESNNEQIKTGEKVLEKTSIQFTTITKNIQQIVDSINQTTEASRQLSQGSQEIATSTEDQATAVNQIDNLAENLEDMASNFKELLADTQIGKLDIELDLDDFDRDMNNITEADSYQLKKNLGLSNQFVIGIIARLEPIKGHEFFLKGLKSLVSQYSNLTCLIIGDGSLENELKEKVQSYNLDDVVKFLGYREDIKKLMTVIDLIVLTSQKEGMPPRIIMEAMAAEKPVVVTETSGTKVLVDDNENGLIIKYNNQEQLKESMEYFINDQKRLEEFGVKGREKIEELA